MRKTLFPITRIHEPMRLEMEIENGQVQDAWIADLLFRNFEKMMIGRDPRDAALFLQRICGICSSAHAVAAAMAQQQAFQVQATPTGQHLTNLIFAADIIQNHLRHFYILVLYDYVKGLNFPPYVPRSNDYRLPERLNNEILEHAKQGMMAAARAHEMMAIFGAKAPHQQTIMATGVTETARPEQLMAYRSILRELKQFVEKVYIPDVQMIAEFYPEYYDLGTGPGNMISYGSFSDPVTGERAFRPGVLFNKTDLQPVLPDRINTHLRYSWYEGSAPQRIDGGEPAKTQLDKPEAYSWIKAPRYQDTPMECGPLARGWINGFYRRGISVLDRIMARAIETREICRLAEEIIEKIPPGSPTLRPFTVPAAGKGFGLTDSMRGALAHSMTVESGKVKGYRIITPTEWNFSPRDTKGVRGAVEQAVIGTPVAEQENLIEVGRIIRSFDPCFTCATHIIRR